MERTIIIINAVKVLAPSAIAFLIGLSITPTISKILYKKQMWKKKARNKALGGGETPIFNKLHREKEIHTPRMGGLVIFFSVLITSLLFWAMSYWIGDDFSQKLNFLSRNQTWLPFFTLIIASIIGFIDDLLVIKASGGYVAGGLPLKLRIGLVVLIGLVGGWWFFAKLGVTSIYIPFWGELTLGIFFIPLFTIVMLAIFSGGVIDGIDGLAGGIMISIFSAYGIIAFVQNQINLSAFCFVVAGAILAFLWFNIPPARFFMTETGILGLTTSISVVAFLTEQVTVLPIIALPLFVTSGSVIIQMLSKRFRGKKVFLVAPIHHHFEAIGWPAYKVTMRFWVIGVIAAVFGVIIALIG
jgi:phospho-N-acetylmuramoyl-pentapeptide-transferase